MARQLTLDLPVRAALGREDFFVSAANAHAVARIDTQNTWPRGKLALVGPAGSGKTHLAHVWATETGARVVPSANITALDIGALSTGLAVDDADALPGSAEATLFHIHNRLGELELPLLLIGQAPPARWSITLPDLRSRLEATDVVRIEPPDDALLAAVLVKLFSDRGLVVPPNLIDWMLRRMDRSFAAAQDLVRRLDEEALSEGRAVTRRLAARLLERE